MEDESGVLLWTWRISFFLLLIIAVTANGLALIALWSRPALRSPSNRFVVSLLLVNLLGCGGLVPLQLVDTWSDGTYRPILCPLGEAVASGFCAASIFSVLLIVADQYRVVNSPLHFHRPSAAVDGGDVAICLAWLVALFLGAASAASSPEDGSLWVFCGCVGKTHRSVRMPFAVVFAVFVLAMPLATLCWLYVGICDAARANEARTRRCSTVSSLGVANASSASSGAPVPVPIQTPTVSGDTARQGEAGAGEEEGVGEGEGESGQVARMQSETRRPSCPLPARFTRRISLTMEARATRVSAAVAAMALICWIPYSVVLAVHAASPTLPPPRIADQVAFAALAASASVSPWLFAYRSRQLRQEIIAVPRRMSRFHVLASQL